MLRDDLPASQPRIRPPPAPLAAPARPQPDGDAHADAVIVLLSELAMETLLPADDETAAVLRQLHGTIAA